MFRHCAYLALLAFIFIVPTEKIVEIPGLGSLASLVGALLLLIWICSAVHEKELRSLESVHILFLVFIFWNALSYFWSMDEVKTLERAFTWFQLGLLVIVIWDLLDSDDKIRAGLQAYVFGAVLGSCGIIYNVLNATEFVPGRYSAAGQHSVNIGLIMSLGIPIAWYLMLTASEKKTSGDFLKKINGLSVPLLCIGIALTGSRGAMVAAFPAILFMLASYGELRTTGKVAMIVFSVLSAYFALWFVPPQLFERLGTTYNELFAGGSINGRTIIWVDAYSRFVDNPILGVGSNAFKTISETGFVVHNSLLSVAVETGLVGLILFLSIGFISLSYCFRLKQLEGMLWVCMLLILALGSSALTYEHHKPTWLIVAFIAAFRFRPTVNSQVYKSTPHVLSNIPNFR